MSEHPKFNDATSWRKIGNASMFLAGAICFLFWLCNGPLCPNPNVLVHGHTRLVINSGIHPDHITGFAGFMLHTGLLWLGLALIGMSARNQIRWKKQREAIEFEERIERTQSAASPISQLGSRRGKDKKKQEDIEIVVNGKKVMLKPNFCDVGNLILPGDPRFAGLTFDKVIGQLEAKTNFKELLHFLNNPVAYLAMEAKVPRGTLLHGTHGVGKTMMVRMLAAMSHVAVVEVSGSDFSEMLVGVGASRMRLLFEYLDYLASIFGAAILFIDEFDAVARVRGGANSHPEAEHTLNALLKEMDGITPRPNVYTIAASNRLDILDPAAIRPGRFDTKIEFVNPNRKERAQLIAINLSEHLRAPGLDLNIAAKACPGASGSHCANIANMAKILAVRAGLNLVTQDILDEAVLVTVMGARREGVLATEMEIDTVRVHESGHALVYMKLTGRAPLRFTMVPRGRSGGHVAVHEQFESLLTKEYLTMRLAFLMGGSASTLRLRDGQEDSGVGMDVKMATELAVQMVTEYGMSSLGMFHLPTLANAGLVSDDFKLRILKEVQSLVDEGKKTAMKIVDENLDDLRKLVLAIDEYETMLEPDFKREFKLTYEDEEPSALKKAAISVTGGSNE